jgi:hypothetical protein
MRPDGLDVLAKQSLDLPRIAALVDPARLRKLALVGPALPASPCAKPGRTWRSSASPSPAHRPQRVLSNESNGTAAGHGLIVIVLPPPFTKKNLIKGER